MEPTHEPPDLIELIAFVSGGQEKCAVPSSIAAVRVEASLSIVHNAWWNVCGIA